MRQISGNGLVSFERLGAMRTRRLREVTSHVRANYGLYVSFASKKWLLASNVRRGLKFFRGNSAERRAIGRHYFFLPMKLLTPTIEVDGDGMRFLAHTKDHVIAADMFTDQKTYEIEVMSKAIELASRIAGRDVLLGKTFVDVGANIGTSTVPALKRFGASRAICLEPEPENAKLLRCNLILNELEQATKVLQVAVSDEGNEVELLISTYNLGDHRVHLGGNRSIETAAWESKIVPVRRLDDVLEESDVLASDVGLLWIDTQGHEAHVLKSAKNLLDYGVPTVVEYWPSVLGDEGIRALNEVIEECFESFLDLRSPAPQIEPAGEVGSVARRLIARAEEYTDLLLVPAQRQEPMKHRSVHSSEHGEDRS
jgi:FkbM family methyltransferase